jgi:hypothetical protein
LLLRIVYQSLRQRCAEQHTLEVIEPTRLKWQGGLAEVLVRVENTLRLIVPVGIAGD